MLFNSVEFAIFLPIVAVIYFILQGRSASRTPANVWLVLASYFYYMCADVRYGLLLLAVTLVTYFAGRTLLRDDNSRLKRRSVLAITVFLLIGTLFFFKYGSLLSSLMEEEESLKIILPVGISFYIFQSLTYVFEIYQGKVKTAPSFISYAAFASFFPVLLSGPIEKSSHLMPQFEEKHVFDYERIRHGLIRMAYGFFLKLVLASRLAISVDLIYDNYMDATGYQLLLGTCLYSVQIFCDFASYSTIAIGVAEILGFTLTENFTQPFFTDSCAAFWRHWHITLNNWFRDYVYIPLGGNRKGTFRKYLNIFIVFTLSGMWHGADITYILWGMLSGLFQIMEALIAPLRAHFPKWLKVFFTFMLFTFSMFLFRSDDMEQAAIIIGKVFTDFRPESILTTSPFSLGLGVFHLLFLIVGLIILLIYDIINERTGDAAKSIATLSTPKRWVIYYLFVVMILGSTSIGAQQFIYFQF
ncbi:MAG: MBOAT family protein [Lachnospiraceae bacterium]|nr:MBOAT family protein [Lachnospiraceae bacterium]